MARNIFEHVAKHGDDKVFEATPTEIPTAAYAGSKEKIDAMRRRLESGEDIWHDLDEYRADAIHDGQSSGQKSRKKHKITDWKSLFETAGWSWTRGVDYELAGTARSLVLRAATMYGVAVKMKTHRDRLEITVVTPKKNKKSTKDCAP